MNILMAIADSNSEYVDRLTEVLQQYEDLSIHIYTSGEKFQKAVDEKRFDVALFDPDLWDEMLTFSKVKLPLCLYSDEARNAGRYADVAKVAKYQRISAIYKDIVGKYAEKAGYTADFDRSQNTYIVAVYSPVGGSGKTTVALSLASRLTAQGKTVLLVPMEQLSSSVYVNPKKENGLILLLEAVENPNVNFELKMKGVMKQGLNGMYYIEGFERLADYDAATGEEISEVLDRIKRCGICDVVIVDMDTRLDSAGHAVMEAADRIVIVEKAGELPDVKMGLFARQAVVNEYRHKMVRVGNFAESSQADHVVELDVPLAGIIHNYGNLQLKDQIHAICANREIFTEKIIR